MKTNAEMLKEKYQTVYITIKGKVYSFSGPAMPYQEGEIIENIQFSEQKDLPNGMKFEKIDDVIERREG